MNLSIKDQRQKMPQQTYQEFSFGILKGLRYSDNLVVIAYIAILNHLEERQGA